HGQPEAPARFTLRTTLNRRLSSGDYQKKTRWMSTITERIESRTCDAGFTMAMNSASTMATVAAPTSRIFQPSGNGTGGKETELFAKTIVFVLCYNPLAMPHFPKDHVFILPH